MDRANFERLLKQGYFEEPSPVRPPDFSDAGNADIFTHRYKGQLIFTDALGWLFWNGKVWERGDHKAESLAMDFTGDMLTEAKQKYASALHTLADVKAQAAGYDGGKRRSTSSIRLSCSRKTVSQCVPVESHVDTLKTSTRNGR